MSVKKLAAMATAVAFLNTISGASLAETDWDRNRKRHDEWQQEKLRAQEEADAARRNDREKTSSCGFSCWLFRGAVVAIGAGIACKEGVICKK
jgi:hypothetical protein